MINENGAYISSYAANTSLDIDDNEIEVHPISQKAAKAKTKAKRKGNSR